jgi:hypothetical protein
VGRGAGRFKRNRLNQTNLVNFGQVTPSISSVVMESGTMVTGI